MLAAVLSIGAAVADDGVKVDEKLSASTQMFIMDRDAIYKNVPVGQRRQAMSRAQAERAERSNSVLTPAVCIDGVDMMRAFISIDESHIGELEALGVIIRTRATGFVTAFIPVDKIEAVAALPAVTHIQAATRMQPCTDKARIDTKAYDVINFTDAAKQAGLSTPYTGKGIVLGVIDESINFSHIAFQDKNEKTRFKHAYYASQSDGKVTYKDLNGTDISGYVSPDESSSHGTHTSSIAGGSSVIIDDEDVTVTNDHSSATYGGMAPETDLILCDFGTSGSGDDVVVDYLNMIFSYADSVETPAVVNMSFGSFWGPCDGTGYVADYIKQKANDGTHICVIAAANNAKRNAYAFKENTTQQDTCLLLWNYTDNGTTYNGYINAYSRDANLPLAAQVMVLDTLTGEVVWNSGMLTKTVDFLADDNLKKITEFYDSDAVDKKFQLTFDTEQGTKKHSVKLNIYSMKSKVYTEGDKASTSRYYLALAIIPADANASTTIDAWCGQYDGTFITAPSSEMQRKNYKFIEGSNLCTVYNYGTCEDAITVGSYITRNTFIDRDGDEFKYDIPLNDISSFSSFVKKGYGPTNRALPDISAPGEFIIAAVNFNDRNYDGRDTISVCVNNSDFYSYGTMRGTSMAAPVVTGIVALWLQAAKENGIVLDTKKVKEIMQATATRDEYTEAHATQFGENGKINALAGLQQILSMTGLEEKQISDLAARDVESIHYVNLLGQSAAKPFPGLNIRVTTYTDGSTDAVKVRF